ncbi:6421_t:CDS:2 [Paraglomus brasilianum]|uniref:6421_t:CDS:1 n=1 Tax=Paraglomus brasilianum TaxID=144538 RepID=A0A9N8WH18_9GLOM|nr:6421_t:CDS:2 [Paraglomus brasilianum]
MFLVRTREKHEQSYQSKRVITDFRASRYNELRLRAFGNKRYLELNKARREVLFGDSYISLGPKKTVADTEALELQEDIKILTQTINGNIRNSYSSKHASSTLRSRATTMVEKYIAAALYRRFGSYTMDDQLRDTSFDPENPIKWKSLVKRKAQFSKVSRVLTLCGVNLPADLLSIARWYEPLWADIPEATDITCTSRRRRPV